MPAGYALLKAVRRDGGVVDWELLDANAFVCGRWKRELAEVRGQHLSAIMADAIGDELTHLPRTALAAGEVIEATALVPSASGTGLRHVTIVPLGEEVVAAFTRDISGEVELQARASALAERVWDVTAVTDSEGRLKWVSEAVWPALGHRPDDLIGRSAFDLIHHDDTERIVTRFAEVVADPASVGHPIELRVIAADGTNRWFECIGANRLEDPVLQGLVVSLHDIDERIRSQRALTAAEVRTRSILESAGDAIVTVNDRGQIEQFNRAAERIFHARARDIVGSSYLQFLPEPSTTLLRDHVARGHDMTESPVDVIARRSTGESFPAQVTLSVAVLDGAAVYTAILRDMTAQRAIEAERHYLAHHDELTGLANRRLVLDHLTTAIRQHDAAAGSLGVLNLKIDDFGLVNDSVGHEVGDRLLVAVAERISDALESSDLLGRLGGAQFVVICSSRPGPEAVVRIARAIADRFREPLRTEGQEVYVTASIGVDIFRGSEAALDLLRRSDTAMHRAKNRGGGAVAVFDEVMVTRLTHRLGMQSALRRAVHRDELRAHYQPIVDLDTRAITHVEALARWPRADGTLVPPTEFISVAERTGLIVRLGEWILGRAIADCAAWQGHAPGVGVSVNVSPRQLELTDLPSLVGGLLAERRLAPELLVLEMTESILLRDADRTLASLDQIHDLGVRIALDDFGTGYSSLRYLHRLPIDQLKIDRSFVRSIGSAGDDTLIEAIIRLGHILRLDLVAEGIDTLAKLEAVRGLGCQYGQGFLFARPTPIEELDSLLRGGHANQAD